MEDDIRKKVEKEEEKRNAAAEKKRVQKLQGDSTKIISKVSPIIASLSKARSHKSWSMIPSPMQLKYDRTMEKLEEYKTEAQKRMQDNAQPFYLRAQGSRGGVQAWHSWVYHFFASLSLPAPAPIAEVCGGAWAGWGCGWVGAHIHALSQVPTY